MNTPLILASRSKNEPLLRGDFLICNSSIKLTRKVWKTMQTITGLIREMGICKLMEFN